MSANSPLQNYLDRNLPGMVRGYIEAIYFTEAGMDSGITNENPISSEFSDEIRQDCESFLRECWKYNFLNWTNSVRLGHHFWLNRNGHGSGFWDSPEIYGYIQAEKLSKLAHSYGECCVYAVDDGMIYG